MYSYQDFAQKLERHVPGATRFTNNLPDTEVHQSNLLLWLWRNILSNQRGRTSLTGKPGSSYFLLDRAQLRPGWCKQLNTTPTVRFKKKTSTFLSSAGCFGNCADMAAELAKGVEQVSVGKEKKSRIAGAGKLLSKLAFPRHVCPDIASVAVMVHS